jgi:hypothetical protein
MPPGGYSTGLAEPEARSVQETCDQDRQVTFTWFDPRSGQNRRTLTRPTVPASPGPG